MEQLGAVRAPFLGGIEIIDINELRRLAQAVQGSLRNIHERVNAIHNLHDALPSGVVLEILDRLEAAESDGLEQARLLGMSGEREAALLSKLEAAEKEREMDEERIADLMADLNRVGHENDKLRAKIAEMERQEPFGWLLDGDFYEVRQKSLYSGDGPIPGQTALYALPGAQGE